MTTTIGLRELQRDTGILDRYDYIKIEDKKTHTPKGIFVSAEYAEEIEKLMQQKLIDERQKKWERIKPFVGTLEREERYKRLEGKELMEEVAKAKCGL